MILKKLDDYNVEKLPYTALLYCKAGVGKSTAIGLIAEASEGKTLVLDIDRTIQRTLAKHEIVKDTSKVDVMSVDNINTFDDWIACLKWLKDEHDAGRLDYENIAVDNISELERCILADLGRQGKNKGVPAMGDYQYMQFKIMNSLRWMKSLGVNVIWTAWETAGAYTHPDGSTYTRLYPKINDKILDNVCGLCDVVGRIGINKDGEHAVLLSATQNIYAKNHIDTRKSCLVEDFSKFEYYKKTEENE